MLAVTTDGICLPRWSVCEIVVLPWVQVKGLASTILSRAARQLSGDWQQQQSYGYSPLLLETLVDAARFRGTCYRAANWICLGETTGGVRTDRLRQSNPKTAKLIFVFPLHRRAQQLLCLTDPPSQVSESEG